MEIWKPIQDWSMYSVSNLGRIKNNKTGRIRKLQANPKTGVIQCQLRKVDVAGIRITRTISVVREVARAFLPTFEESMIVRFRDGDRSNIAVSNLYMARQEDILREVNTCMYLITYPDGSEEYVVGIVNWCKEHGFDRSNLAHRQFTKGKWKGFKVEKLS
ncbi:NUMOD4 domain-containing protein [Vibrio vulnificus]|uniref:NUMOD4 domain-containing protein n=1 Tax=Vibrio vulnificus TaxID=672 RepID=UPI0015935197|nr:NUMOD4 domain-containing protein [Vibrio vulnificus]NVC72623.1 hypothetical protein [Vibrio vulnificus]